MGMKMMKLMMMMVSKVQSSNTRHTMLQKGDRCMHSGWWHKCISQLTTIGFVKNKKNTWIWWILVHFWMCSLGWHLISLCSFSSPLHRRIGWGDIGTVRDLRCQFSNHVFRIMTSCAISGKIKSNTKLHLKQTSFTMIKQYQSWKLTRNETVPDHFNRYGVFLIVLCVFCWERRNNS